MDCIQLYVQTLTGKTITLHVKESSTIRDLKTIIQDQENILVNHQCLIFARTQLDDSKTLEDYSITEESTVFLVVKLCPEKQIFVKTHYDKTVPLMIEDSNTVKSLKVKIQEMEGIPVQQQRLTFGGTKLKSNKTLSEYAIQENSYIQLTSKSKSSAKIYVETLTGKTFMLKVRSDESIESIKAKIQDREGILPQQQQLFHNEMQLDENKTVAQNKIQENTTLQLRLLLHDSLSSQEESIVGSTSIFVRTLTGTSVELQVNKNATIEEVKAMIDEREGIPKEKQCLVFSGKQLEDSKTLTDYGIIEESMLYLVARLTPYLQISVEMSNGDSVANKTIALEASATDTIRSIKEKIEEQEGFPVDDQQLCCKGEELEDYKLLTQCTADTLQLRVNCQGDTHIHVETLTGKAIRLSVGANTTIEEVKAQIETKEGIPVDQQNLVFSGKQLDNCETIADCGIEAESTIYLVVSSCTKSEETQLEESLVLLSSISDYTDAGNSSADNSCINSDKLKPDGSLLALPSNSKEFDFSDPVESLSLTNDHPQRIKISVGDSISLAVQAEGKDLTYQWHKDGVSLKDEGNHYCGMNTSSLTISQASVEHSGEYQCVVENVEGTITSSLFTVTITDKEKATKHLWSVMAIATTLIIGIWLLYSLLTSWTSLVVCSELPPLENGQVTYIPDNKSLTFGTLAVYFCNEGYSLQGGAVRICMRGGSIRNGLWTSQTPSCQSAGSVAEEDQNNTLQQTHPVKSIKELYQTLSSIGNWEALCMNLGVDHGMVSDLIYSTHDVSIKKKRCLEFYFNGGTANWEEVIVAVVGPPIYNNRLARTIADKYLLDYRAVVNKSEL